jgi:hypothetical protein
MMKSKTLWRMKRFSISGLTCRIFKTLIIFWISSRWGIITWTSSDIRYYCRLNSRFNSNYNRLFLSRKLFNSIIMSMVRSTILMINMILLIISICFLMMIKISSIISRTSLILTSNQLSRGYSDHHLFIFIKFIYIYTKNH